MTTTYYLNGSQIVAEETSGNLTVYIYDAEGLPLGMRYHGAAYAEDVWDVYWYEKNIFGDVVAVYNSAGTKLISYKYDAFGKATRSYHNSGGSTTATKNPFRYRGYYYDYDIRLYYLQSRYYDCKLHRFISPDNAAYLGANGGADGLNLYAYCGNNPVNRVDFTGHSWAEIWEAIKIAASEIGRYSRLASPAYAIAGCSALADGPIPVGDAIGLVITVVTAVAVVGCGIYSAIHSLPNERECEDTLVLTPPKKQAIFTKDPYAFNPQGLVRTEYVGSKNGRIIKWSDPSTNMTIFEWDEDYNYGAHYHILVSGDHAGDHILPGTAVPEPWNSVYFGG